MPFFDREPLVAAPVQSPSEREFPMKTREKMLCIGPARLLADDDRAANSNIMRDVPGPLKKNAQNEQNAQNAHGEAG